eukprot:4996601-Amphidinium_carterae.1
MYFAGLGGRAGGSPDPPRKSRCTRLRPCCPPSSPVRHARRSNPVRRSIVPHLSGTRQRPDGWWQAVA